jgi:hypothetical protein
VVVPNLLCALCVARSQNLRGLRKFSAARILSNSEIPRAKHAKNAKFGNLILSFAAFAFFARDIPRLTGARSAPYENLRALRVLRGDLYFALFAPFAVNYPMPNLFCREFSRY